MVPVDGFNPERIRSLKRGIATTLGGDVAAAAILDKDYRGREECTAIEASCSEFCDLVIFHDCKEIENLLLVPSALDRAAKRRVVDRAARKGGDAEYSPRAAAVLSAFAAERKSYVISQYLASRRKFERVRSPSRDEASANQAALEEFEAEWASESRRLELIPGKEALAHLNTVLQKEYGISITPNGIVDAMKAEEVPRGMTRLLERLAHFAPRVAEP